MDKLKIIVKDTYKRNVKNFSFFTMVITPILVMIAIVLISYFITKPDSIKNTAVISEEQNVINYLKDTENSYKIDESIKTTIEAEKAMIKGTISSYLVVNEENENFKGQFTTVKVNDSLETLLTNKLDLYYLNTLTKEEGITSDLLEKINTKPSVNSQLVYIRNNSIVQDNESSNIKKFISSAMCIMIFLFIMNYSVIIGQEIASEKGSKIMEVILSSTTASVHLSGKLIGVLLMCLTQIAIYVILGIIGWVLLSHNAILQTVLSGISFDDATIKIIIFNLLYFILSVVSFTLIAAVLASLVSRTEDTPKALQPLTLLGMGGFYLGITMAQNNPTDILIKIFSYVPFVSNFTMPFRISSDTVGLIGAISSILIYLIFDILLFIFTMRIYKVNVLVYQSDVGIFKKFLQITRYLLTKKKPKYA